jgi:regulator of protease activity HflC (stomatin/prohibitin superfamily)
MGNVTQASSLQVLAVSASLTCGACAATIPPGFAGVLVTPSGVQPNPVQEGVTWISPLSTVDLFDVRGQQRTEDLQAIAADGAPVEARASLVTYSLVRSELPTVDRQIGPRYYDVVVAPLVRASVRLVIAGYRSEELTPNNILRAQTEITELVAARLKPFHIVVESIDLRTLAVVLSEISYQIVTDTGIEEQVALAAPQRLALARQRAQDRRVLARGIADAHAKVAPDLSSSVLADTAARAWTALASAPSSAVVVLPSSSPANVEISP